MPNTTALGSRRGPTAHNRCQRERQRPAEDGACPEPTSGGTRAGPRVIGGGRFGRRAASLTSVTRTARAKGRRLASGRVTKPSARYTPPVPRQQKVSPRWVGVLIVALLVGGVVMTSTSYYALQPGGPQLLLLLVGAAFIAAGFIALMRLR